ncbi:SDR family NAD(P)-dependent oxidoreductase [Paenibacillus nasutitermitis]|uniref:Dehydrogenase n=1 Tax=Paenibacillus nasutitermitis TaxID=1652958 RepID=A0A916ZBH1_9BACL|nr:SDR family oxidoreductase [Paenibacillus nasutitermitis]GGD86092.1 dehydrogenase [Paenibacillus nasutitermitis]
MRGLKGKVAVVTGGAQGLGEAIALRLSEEGCIVWLLDVQNEVVQTAENISRATGNAVFSSRVDIADETQVKDFFSRIASQHENVHILVNNAAAFLFKGVEASPEDWNKILSVNVIGTTLVTQNCIPLLKRSGSGAIVNMSSVSGFIGQSQFATYNATKFAIRGLTKCWAVDLADFGIRVNSVCPGYIRTQAFENSCIALGLDIEGENKRVSDLHILKRQGRPEEVASAVAFLASDDASFITGEDLMADGGYLAK